MISEIFCAALPKWLFVEDMLLMGESTQSLLEKSIMGLAQHVLDSQDFSAIHLEEVRLVGRLPKEWHLNVSYHCEDPREALREMWRGLAPRDRVEQAIARATDLYWTTP